MNDEEQAGVTVFVTPPPHAWRPASRRCLRCGSVLDGSEEQETCSAACKQALHRFRKSGKVQRLVRAVLLAQVGEEPENPPPFWPLIRRLVRREVARFNAEQKAKLLPGAGR